MLKIPRSGKLIDAGQLYNYADGEYNKLKNKQSDSELIKFAENVRDTIGEMAYDLPDLAPAQGEWLVECLNRRRCSNCAFGRNTDIDRGWNFCPNCGAKMRGYKGYG